MTLAMRVALCAHNGAASAIKTSVAVGRFLGKLTWKNLQDCPSNEELGNDRSFSDQY